MHHRKNRDMHLPPYRWRRLLVFLALAGLVAMSSGCGVFMELPAFEQEGDCPEGETENPITGQCQSGEAPDACQSGTWDEDGDASTPCVPWTDCEPGEAVDEPGSATSDRTCEACAPGTYSDGTNRARCQPWTDCVSGEFVDATGTATSDRICTSCPPEHTSTGPNAAMCFTDACLQALGVSCDEFEQAYLKASNTDRGDYFGFSVSLSGDTLAVGAPFEDSSATGVDGNQNDDSAQDSGAVYVFTRSNGVWSQQAYLKASNTDSYDNFGSVSLSGDTLAVGAPFEDSNATGVDGDQNDNSRRWEPARPMSSCATVMGTGRSRPTSRPPIPTATMGSASLSRSRRHRWWSGAWGEASSATGSMAIRSDNSRRSGRRGLCVRARAPASLVAAGLPQGFQYRG